MESRFSGDCLADQLLSAHAQYRHWSSQQKLLRDVDRHYVEEWTPAKLNMDDPSAFPVVSTAYKCSSVRLFVLWLASTFGTLNTSFYVMCRSTMLVSLSNYILITAHGDFALSDAECEQAYAWGRRALLNFQYVSMVAVQEQTCLFRCLPKSHSFDHSLYLMQRTGLNPYYWETWGEESLLGRWKKIVSRVHSVSVMRRSMQRYTIRLCKELRMPAAADEP